MGKISGRDCAVGIEDSANACQSLSGDFNDCTLSWTSEEMDVTGFGAVVRERAANTLQDWNFSMTGFFNADTDKVYSVLKGVGPGGSTRLAFGPSGSTSGSVRITACAILNDFSIQSTLTAAVAVTATLAGRAGSITFGTWT